MYGLIVKGALKATPHLVKGAAGLGTVGGIGYGLGVAGTAAVNAVNPGFIEQAYKNSIEGDDEGVFKGRGITAALTKHFVEEGDLEKKKQRLDVTKNVLGPSGYSAEDLGLSGDATRFDAQVALGRKQRQEAAELRKQNREDALRPLEMQMAENAAARRDQMMMRADDLALQRDRLMLEDQRYNERLDREERNRRQESIMAMMSGLASLGAAFAM